MLRSRAIIKTVSSVNLVFGLDWFALLGGSAKREVKRIARQNKASYAVRSADDAASVGVATLQVVRRGGTLYSAAQILAQRFSTGTVALVLPLSEEQWWFVAIHEGAVVARTDFVCTSYDEAITVIEQLRQSYPALIMLGDGSAQVSVAELAAERCGQAELRRVSYGGRLLSQPLVRISLLGVVVGMLFQVFSFRDNLHLRDVSDDAVSAREAWNQAIRKVTDEHWIHGVAGTRAVLHTVYGVPAILAGWQLLHVDCNSEGTNWSCKADYKRGNVQASNEDFLNGALSDWTVSVVSLEHVQVSWQHVSEGLNLTQTALQDKAHNERYLFSRIQALQPAFNLFSIETARTLVVVPPSDEQGQPMRRPVGLPQLGTRTLRIQAPLRSLSVLLPYCDAITWQRVIVSFDPQHEPDLNHSQLNLTLHGVLYEKA